jgi:hypothetical protein
LLIKCNTTLKRISIFHVIIIILSKGYSEQELVMDKSARPGTIIKYSCGEVELELSGNPILSVICYCDDCQAGARQIEALENAPAVLDADGGTSFILYRKDRVRKLKGENLLKSYKLKEKTATNRVTATCCNTVMYLGFDDSKHWVSVYRKRFEGENRNPDMRICTKFKPENTVIPNDVPSYPSFSFRFISKLLGAKIAMMVGK